jgi:transposase
MEQGAAMERLEAKRIHGHVYYYYSKWERKDGRCRRVWQRYLGKLEDIVQAVEGGPQPTHAEVFQFGLPEALWRECQSADLVSLVDAHCPKRNQGLTPGQYLIVAAINRAIAPSSKRSLWDWFGKTVLLRHLPQASAAALSSQRFWDHMDRIDANTAAAIWKDLLQGIIRREAIDLSSLSYDGTNFYTFIDTFNLHCEVAKRGKNKQGRNNLRQVSYALFCCADGQLPLYYDVYDGNRNDAKQFPVMLRRFDQFFRELTGDTAAHADTTLIFDKGNNSEDNLRLLDKLHLKFVGSVKLDQHRDLAEVPNEDARFQPCGPHLEGTKAFRVRREVAGKERVLVVTYNQNLFDAQWQTVQNDMSMALEKLSGLRKRLEDRVAGLIKGGQTPTVASVEKQCQTSLSRQHMKQVIRTQVRVGSEGIPRLEYCVDGPALQKLCATYLGKNILISNRDQWTDEQIIRAYRSQYLIEAVFKVMKDRRVGTWWPLNHWTDRKIRVHALYCTIGYLLRGVMHRRIQQAGVQISLPRLVTELGDIREVVSFYPQKRRRATVSSRTVLSKRSELQEKLLSILQITAETEF